MLSRVPTLHPRMQVRQLHAPGRAWMRNSCSGEQWLDRRGALRQLPPAQRGDRRVGKEVDPVLGGTETEIVTAGCTEDYRLRAASGAASGCGFCTEDYRLRAAGGTAGGCGLRASGRDLIRQLASVPRRETGRARTARE